jgi:hypothetical protein
VPPRTIGDEAKTPNVLAPFRAKRHFAFSCETVSALIEVWVVARVFERS